MKKDTLLIVDDTPANVALLFDHLVGIGYRVLVADNGIDAVEQINQIKPDLILLDVRMPGMDGYETCRAIKSNVINADIPIIFISALSDTDDRLKGFESGGIDYVTKPINVLEVAARIQTHVNVANLQRQLTAQNEKLEELVGVRTSELEDSNQTLRSEVERRRQQESEKEQLLKLFEEQNQQLRNFTSWLLASRPEVKVGLVQLITKSLLSNWTAIGDDLDKLSHRIEKLALEDGQILGLVKNMRLRNTKVDTYLHQMLDSGKLPDQSMIQPASPAPSILSQREQEILRLLCDGISTSQIAKQLSIADVTIRTHRARIMQKLNTQHFAGLIKYAIRHGLTELN